MQSINEMTIGTARVLRARAADYLRAAELLERLNKIAGELEKGIKKSPRRLSRAGIARIRAAQKARWAKVRKENSKKKPPNVTTMSRKAA